MSGRDLRSLLLGIRSITLTADGSTDGPAWQRRGAGSVVPREVAPGEVEWEESGRWSEGPTSVPYRNRLHWRLDGPTLHLSHARFGSAAPVPLLTLVTNEHGALVPRAPHLCGADLYALTLTRTDETLTLHWRVDGPHKAYRLTTTYR